jgi:hypothetical protein
MELCINFSESPVTDESCRRQPKSGEIEAERDDGSAKRERNMLREQRGAEAEDWDFPYCLRAGSLTSNNGYLAAVSKQGIDAATAWGALPRSVFVTRCAFGAGLDDRLSKHASPVGLVGRRSSLCMHGTPALGLGWAHC